MKKIQLSNTGIYASNIVMGCMRINQISINEAETLIKTALDEGINFFDHADIYGGGDCESRFAEAIGMNPTIREKMFIQTKCGITNGHFDFSKEHIIKSVEGSLKRLKTDYLDVLLLHRPDTLMEPEEVAEAFNTLQAAGKVRHFGVSNQNPMQMELLSKYISQKLVANQLQLSVAHTPMIKSGLTVNMAIDQGINREGSVLEYCRLKDVTIQAWSPFQKGFFDGVFLEDRENYAELNKLIDELAEQYHVTNTAIAVAFITRHPANMQVILGTTKPQRMKDSCKGSDIKLTRDEWYRMFKAAGNIIP